MRKFLEKINPKILKGIFLVGIIAILLTIFYSLFIEFNFRSLFSIPIYIIFYINFVAERIDTKRANYLAGGIFIFSFIVLSFIDFGLENYTNKTDWKSCKGYVYYRTRGTRHSPGRLLYRFNVNNKQIEGEKPYSLTTNLGIKKYDSIYVVYSESNPLINDIYQLEKGPNLTARNNFIIYFIKNNAFFKWVLIMLIIGLILKYLNNRNTDKYPINKK